MTLDGIKWQNMSYNDIYWLEMAIWGQKELSNESSTEETSGNVYSLEFKQKVVKYAKENGFRAVGRKFQILPSSVRFWKWGLKTGYKTKVRKYADDFNEMVVSFGVGG